MCTNQRLITNCYTGKDLYVKCGHCPACLQEKAAHRVRRIKDTSQEGYIKVMVGLTYSRGTSPYVDRNEAYLFSKGKLPELNVYRDSSFRKVRVDKDYHVKYKRTNERVVLTSIPFSGLCSFANVKDMKFEHDKISVNYYPDYQKFMARLRLNLKRHFGYDKPFKTYTCSEYGAKSFRSHFHLLMDIPADAFEVFRVAVAESWPFSDLLKFPRAFEKSFRGNSYVASYVNCGTDFPKFFEKYFKPKHSYSKGYGLGNPNFSLDSILKLYYRGTLSFGVLRDKQGIPTIDNVPVPAYALHRYFPKFKGLSRVSPLEVSTFMHGVRNFEYDKVKSILDSHAMYYSHEEFNRFSVLLNNSYKRFNDDLRASDRPSASFSEYCTLHQKIWRLHASTVLRLHLLNDDIPLNEKYDNLDVVKYMHLHFGSPLPPGFILRDLKVTDPNKFQSNLRHTRQFAHCFHDNIKHRKVTNTIMSFENEEW